MLNRWWLYYKKLTFEKKIVIKMKKVLLGITLLLALTSCDDGDVKVESINFDDITPQKCTEKNLFYKINGSEALLMDVSSQDAFNVAFQNEETPEGTPRTFPISATEPNATRVIYRAYNGTVAFTKFCGSLTDANPSVTEEWIATSGTGEVITTSVKTIDATTGVQRITNYNHSIVFKNITFQKPNGQQTYPTFFFGSYQTTPTILQFGFDQENLAKSACDNRLININTTEALELNLDTTTYNNLIQSSVTTTPRTALLTSTNTLKYKLFDALVEDSYFCAATPPTTPVLLQEWIAKNGVANVSGIIEVSTTTSGTQFQHTVHLKNVVFKRVNSEFNLGSDYTLGVFFTN